MTPLSRRQFAKCVALTTGALSLGGCAPWEYADPDRGLDRLTLEPPPSRLESRVLNRLAFGPRPDYVAQLRAMGIDDWIERQLDPESIPESPELLAALGRLETLNLPPDEARDRETEWEPDQAVAPLVKKVFKLGKRRTPSPGPVSRELAQSAVLRAAFSPRSLQEVMVDFWSDHFNVDQMKGDCRWLKTADDHRIRLGALGRFRDLLGASAHSPAMIFYMDNAQNRRSDSPGRSRPNENYARELLELHTLGDTNAYTLRDIQEVARLLTGLTIGESWTGSTGEFIFRDADHDDGEKVVLGERISGGQGERDGEQLLDLLAHHPLTARFIAGKLCYQFLGVVPEGLCERMTRVFLRTDGEIRQLLAELFRSEEFRRDEHPRFKRPIAFVVSALRALGARTSAVAIPSYLESMGQRPFACPQPNGYPVRPEPWADGMLPRWNFAIDLVRNKIDETWINFDALERITRGRPSMEVCRGLSESLLPAPLAAEQLAALSALGGERVDLLQRRLALLLISPQFQWY
jgi:hypothetical protein